MGSGVSLVLVTGAARRLGADLARRFAADGHRVALHAHGSLEDARRICAEIAAKGGEAALFPGDFSKPGGAAAMFDALVAASVVRRFGASYARHRSSWKSTARPRSERSSG